MPRQRKHSRGSRPSAKSSRRRNRSRRQSQRTTRPRPRLTRKSAPLYRGAIKNLVERAYGKLLHAKQVLSLFMISYGILHAKMLSIAAVGEAMARAFGKQPKHGTKQVDRCLSNDKLDMATLFKGFVPLVVGRFKSVLVTMDWTEFDPDDQTTLSLALVTPKGRAIPLVWMTVYKSTLKGRQRKYERQALRMLADAMPKHVHVVLLADRGFGDVKLYNFVHKTLGFDFVIRFRPNIYVSWDGWLQPAGDLVPRNGRIRVLRDTNLTTQEAGPYTVVLYKAAGMKDSWCLATSLSDDTGREVVDLYAQRFQCEEVYRDLKDRRYGYGLRFTKIRDCKRRDRLLLLFSLAYLVQTLMGQTSEQLGLDRELKANTSRERTHSLFRQGRSLLGELAAETYQAIQRAFRDALKALFKQGVLEALI